MISGFTIVRNGLKFEYPFIESWRSLLPVVDELVINVGEGEDGTLDAARQFADGEGRGKARVVVSKWPLSDSGKRKNGMILAEQTNLAMSHCRGDWLLYLQADEVLHEEDQSRIREAIERSRGSPEVEALVFDYVHFYGSFDVVQRTRSAYRREVRAVRRAAGPVSVGDAQSFRRRDGSKLRAAPSGARVFHYGWVKPPEAMREKTVFLDGLYHGASLASPATGSNHSYKRFPGLRPYQGSHPSVMSERIARRNWHWALEDSPLVWSWEDLVKIPLDWFERQTGVRPFEYRSYRWVRRTRAEPDLR